ncbi:MAG: LuxR C-terminal-related transcriptional regulator [Chloroflexota bacterium]
MGTEHTRRTIRPVKLLPPVVPPDAIRRPRLLAALDRAASIPATLVIAGPGYGKTTLLAQWARSARRPGVWISLDPGDDDPVIFASLLAAALERLAPGAMAGVATLLQRQSPDPRVLGEALADALATTGRALTLVLDDYHAVAPDSPVNHLMGAMLGQPPPNAHFVIAARWRPDIPALDALERRGLVDVLDEHDLRFSDADAMRLLRSAMPKDADPASGADLLSRLDGWPAGVRLAWLGLRQSRGRPAEAWRIEIHAREMLDSFDEEDLTLLEPLSVVEEVSPSLAAALGGVRDAAAAEAALAGLARRRQFVTAIGPGGWYRLHQLLRDALNRRLEGRVGAAGIARLHALASDWFEAHDQIAAAIRHAVLAGHVERAVGLIEHHAYGVADRATWDSVRVWMRHLPPGVSGQRPGLLLLEANLLGEDGLIPPMEATMARAAALLDSWPDPEEAEAWRREFDGLACYAASMYGHATATVALARELLDGPRASATAKSSALALIGFDRYAEGDEAGALQILREFERTSTERDVLWATATIGQVWMLMMQGAPAAALAAGLRALEASAAAPAGGGYLGPWAGALAGLMAYELGDLAMAHGIIESADRLGRFGGPWAEFTSAATMALVRRASGDPAGGLARSRELSAALALSGESPWTALAMSLETRFDILDGRPDAGDRLLMQPTLPVTPPFSFVENPLLTRGLALLARGGPGDAGAALACARDLRAACERQRDRWWRGRAKALEAMALDALGDRVRALPLLDEALVEAREGMAQRFVDLGPGLVPLLEAAASESDGEFARIASGLLARRRERTGAAASAAAGSSRTARLTPRELQVLAMLRGRATNREIAEALGVSEGTAKKHVANLLHKLGVTSRRAAGELAASVT